MTLNPLTLEEYFHKIVSKSNATVTIGYEPSWVLVPCDQPSKHEDEGVNMFFNRVKEYAQSLKASWSTLYAWEQPKVEEPETLQGEEDYWAFEMHTSAYECDGEAVPMKHNIIMDNNDSTWHDTLDQILDVMGEHYGYNIKEQVYYSIQFPLNKEGNAGYGRMLNDEVLQQLLLAHPEVYEAGTFTEPAKNVFA